MFCISVLILYLPGCILLVNEMEPFPFLGTEGTLYSRDHTCIFLSATSEIQSPSLYCLMKTAASLTCTIN